MANRKTKEEVAEEESVEKPKVEEPSEAPEQGPKVDELKVVVPVVCGHVNRQHYDTKGRLSELACDLKPGHEGDHHARYMKNVGEPVTDEKGRTVKVNYHEEEADTWWNDAAGKPARDTVVGEIEPLNLHQKDMIMSLLAANPKLTAAQALQQAKASAEWKATKEPS